MLPSTELIEKGNKKDFVFSDQRSDEEVEAAEEVVRRDPGDGIVKAGLDSVVAGVALVSSPLSQRHPLYSTCPPNPIFMHELLLELGRRNSSDPFF